MTRFHFPRETRAKRLAVMLAQPGRTVTEQGDRVLVACDDGAALDEFERHLGHALAVMQITGRLVAESPTTFTIYLEKRQ